jgi:rRNA maturation endonuclease Nob1
MLDNPTTLMTNRVDCYHMTQVMSRYECTACGRKTPNVERTCRKCGGEMENTALPH